MSLTVYLMKRQGNRARVLFERNITHNLAQMASKAGLYEPMWRPDELGIVVASQLVEPLRKGLDALECDPAFYATFNPSNGWGSYEGLVDCVKKYLSACERWPWAKVEPSR